MERLTLDNAIKYIKEVARKNRINKEKNTIIIPNSFISSNDCADKYGQVAKWLEELKSYKEAEEQGLLVRLPCKVGTEVFAILSRDSHCTKCQIKKIEIRPTIFGKICYFAEPVAQRGCCFRYFDTEFGKVIFLTREEAEKKLEEMKK